MKHLLLINLLIVITFFSCKKDDSAFNCDSLRKGLLNDDRTLVQKEVNKILIGLTPLATTSDPNGHFENLSVFMSTIQNCNKITCELDCYNCFHHIIIESKIKISIDSSGVIVQRTIFINTPENQKMTFADLL
jgi:hypothetical protein